jgi:osmotically-inducible protein OsmY
MKSDKQLKLDVERELEWDPMLNADGIGVEVHDRVVTLAGHLGSYAEKCEAERAVRRVAGVAAVVIELDVRISGENKRTDEGIALDARSVLQLTSGLAGDAINVQVENGRITLSGEVDWAHQRTASEDMVSTLRGVKFVFNEIVLRPQATQGGVVRKIEDALKRHATHEAKDIRWSAPGVRHVIDHMEISS